jgi:hypothetical protein
MVLPFVISMPSNLLASGHDHAAHMAHAAQMATAASVPYAGALAVGVHTLAYLVTMTLAAYVVYRKLGLMILRSAWFNLDWLWAATLVVTGVVVFFV